MTPADLGAAIIERCEQAGFAAAGVCDAAPSATSRDLLAWLDAGAHGEMTYLTEAIDVRLDPSRLLKGCRSFVMVADLYAPRGANIDGPAAPAHGRVARYARGIDYHRHVKRRLHALCDALRVEFPGQGFRSFVDTAPVLERELASRCGIGWTAKSTMLIHPRLGSYIVLGGFATTLELRPPPTQMPVADHCGSCTRCIDACPTGAITPYRVDARRCISYLTIENRGLIDPAFHAAMGEWIYGCDVCQEVCPHNSPAPLAVRESRGVAQETYASRTGTLDLAEILAWDENDRRGAFNSSPMKRATLAMMKRNALIALGNWIVRTGEREAIRRIEDVMWSAKEPELVRQTARTVLDRLCEAGLTSPAASPGA